MELKELHKAIDAWGIKKGINTAPPEKQFDKFMEEVWELAEAFDKFNNEDFYSEDNNVDLFTDMLLEMGDVYVTLRMLALTMNTDMDTAISLTYDKISKRSGRMVDGQFVRDGVEVDLDTLLNE